MPADMPADEHYAFRHALTRDAAYQLMPPSARAALHVAAADLIDEIGLADGFETELANHLQAAIAARGGRDGISWIKGEIDQIWAHTHPKSTLKASPSDKNLLFSLVQDKSWITPLDGEPFVFSVLD
jgi:hypothetical protein